MRFLKLHGLLVSLCLAGCICPNSSVVTTSNHVVPEPRPSLKQLKNATFSGVTEKPVTLKDGDYEGAPFEEGGASRDRITLSNMPVAFGDLDGAPGDEAAVLLSRNSGGSGEFVYVAVVGLVEGEPVNLGTAPVGDRVKVRVIGIDRGTIVMEVLEAGPYDPACCPTQLALKRYLLRGGTLKLMASKILGTVLSGSASGAGRYVPPSRNGNE